MQIAPTRNAASQSHTRDVLSDVVSDGEARRDVHVISVDRVSPRIASVFAEGLGLPIEAVADAFYRAPARLVSNLDAGAALSLCELLGELGINATDVPRGPPPPRPALLDIASDVMDAARVDEISAVLGAFTGMIAARHRPRGRWSRRAAASR